MKRGDLNGIKEHPLYKYLKESCPPPASSEFRRRDSFWSPLKISDIQWNFEKFIVSPHGVPIFRLRPQVAPYDLMNLFSDLMSPVKDVVSQKQQLDKTLENIDQTIHHREFHSVSKMQQEQNIVKSLKELRRLGQLRLNRFRGHQGGKMFKDRHRQRDQAGQGHRHRGNFYDIFGQM
jgi:glutathione peroxidase